MHFQMLGIDVAVPKVIRKEFLETIDRGWKAGEETWIDAIAIPTDYCMNLTGEGVSFVRSNLTPLVGSEVKILSKEAVKDFLCIEGGIVAGTLIGFDLPLTVNIKDMVRYHTGFFGFTGCGKSNLTSYLIRKALEKMPDLTVMIFDVAGEYLIHLLDLEPQMYSTEDFHGDVQRILESQTIPETLEERMDKDLLIHWIQRLVEEGRIHRLSLSHPRKRRVINMGFILRLIEVIASRREKESVQALIAANKLYDYISSRGYDDETPLKDIAEDPGARDGLEEILREFLGSIHGMSSTARDIQSILKLLREPSSTMEEGEEDRIRNPEWLALEASVKPGLNIVYVPDPDTARQVVSRFINHLLWLKKTKGLGKTVLTILDEAQEFIPDRTKREDFTDQSNRAVEALLRQGRKYRANCWICSQRVAHLNVNALQQLHSYFVSILPRFYDRMVIADAFSLSYNLLDKTTDLDTGEWLFVSYKATKQRNVPVFVKTPNNEEILLSNLSEKETSS